MNKYGKEYPPGGGVEGTYPGAPKR
jgi:hypothetical protein